MFLFSKMQLKKFFIFLLSITLALSCVLFVACGETKDPNDDNNDDTTTTETITDYQVIKNGDFEFLNKENAVLPYASGISWTRSTDSDNTSAMTSKVNSGIIDTETEAYNNLDSKNKPSYKVEGEDTAINPGTPKSKGLIAQNDYDYEDEEKRVNPNVDGTKILMIHNKTSVDGVGTAQKFKASSAITIPANSFAVFSVWIRTDNLKVKSGAESGFGAYVYLEDKVGSQSYNNIEFTNINTKGEWALLETVIKGSNLASTTINVTFGLGKGNGTFTAEYVEGFAYFDNANAKIYSYNEYPNSDTFSGEPVEKEDEKIINLGNVTYKDNDIESNNLTDKFTKLSASYDFTYTSTETPVTPVGGKAEFSNRISSSFAGGYNMATGNEIGASDKNTINASNSSLKDAIADIDSTELEGNPSLIYFNFKKDNPAVGTYATDEVSLKSGNRHLITFYLKTKAENTNSKMLSVDLIDSTTQSETISSVLTSITTETIDNSTYGEWVKYYVLVYNPTDDDNLKYKLKFTFGDDSIPLYEDYYQMQSGYALIAGLNVAPIDENTYAVASTGSNLYKFSLFGKYVNWTDDKASQNKDSYGLTTDLNGSFEIKTKPASYVSNYMATGNLTKSNVGLINSKYVDNYSFLSESAKTALLKLKDENNDYAQVAVINNKEKANTALVSQTKTLNANTYVIISVKLKVVDDAFANVYLVSNEVENSKFLPLLVKSNVGETSGTIKKLKVTVDKNTYSTDSQTGWVTINFYLKSGDKAIDYRLAVYNGDISSDGSKGTVFVNNYSTDLTTVTSEEGFVSAKDFYKDSFASLKADNIADLPFTTLQHKRANATVYDDEHPNGYTREFDPVEIYASNGLYTFADFSTIDAPTEIDEKTSQDAEDEETEANPQEGYQVNKSVALQIASIIIAIVIIVVLIVILIRNILKKRKKQVAKTREFYNRNTREAAMNKISKKNIIVDDDGDDNVEYDYSAAESIDENAQVEEVEEVEQTEVSQEAQDNQPQEEVIDLDTIDNEPEVVNESKENAESSEENND